MSEQTVLEVVTAATPAEIFSADKLEVLIKRVETEVNSLEPDVSTGEGRDEIKSLAYKISRVKSKVDAARKELGSEYRDKLNAHNAIGKKAKDRLEDLQHKARKPLDDWEAAEEAKIQAEIDAANQYAADWDEAIEYDLRLRMEAIEARERKIREAEEAQLAAQRAEEVRKAAEQAKVDQAKREEEIRAQATKEAERLAEKEKQDAIEAALKKQQDEAAEVERQRLALEQEEQKKAANKNHQNRIKKDAIESMEAVGIVDAARTVDLISSGQIAHVTINY